MLKAQIIGSAVVTLATFGVAMVVMLAVNAIGMLRLPADMEAYGMDFTSTAFRLTPNMSSRRWVLQVV